MHFLVGNVDLGLRYFSGDKSFLNDSYGSRQFKCSLWLTNQFAESSSSYQVSAMVFSFLEDVILLVDACSFKFLQMIFPWMFDEVHFEAFQRCSSFIG